MSPVRSSEPLTVPEWATEGLGEATRLSDFLLAEQLRGDRQWAVADQWWEVEVDTDYIDVSSNGMRQAVTGMTTVTAQVEKGREEWRFVRKGDEWLVMSWREKP